MKDRFKLAFVALLIATIVWGITLYLVLKEYNEFVEGLPEIERLWGDWGPWWRWNGMPWVIVAGMGLLVAWALLINEAIHARARGESRKA
jgi:hypothetical protein